MIRILLILVFACLQLSTAQAQRRAPQNQTPTELETLVSLDSNRFAMVLLNKANPPTTLGIRLINQEEDIVAEKTLDLTRQGLLTQFEGAFEWQGDLIVLTSMFYPGPKRNHLIFQRFSIPSLEEQTIKILDEAYSPQQYRIPFGFNTSANDDYFFSYSWTYTIPDDPAKLSVKVFDRNMEEVWTQRYLLPFKNETFYIYDCAINNEGTAFIFCENYNGKPGKYIDEAKVEHFILAGKANQENLIEYKLSVADEVLIGLQSRLDSSGTIVGAAFTRDDKKKTLIDGVYVFNIPPDGKSIQRSTIPLDNDMYKAAYPYGEKESAFSMNKHKLSTSFLMDHVYLEEDGSMVLVGEYRRENPNYYDIEFNDILVLKVKPNRNSFEWVKRVPKRQTGMQGAWGVYSYQAFKKKGNYFFLFNDNLENKPDEDGKIRNLQTYEGTQSAILLMQVTSEGDLFRNDLTSIARAQKIAAIMPQRAWEISNKTRVVLYGERPLSRSGDVAGLLFYFGWGPDLK